MEGNYCPKCGARQAPDADRCENCGLSLVPVGIRGVWIRVLLRASRLYRRLALGSCRRMLTVVMVGAAASILAIAFGPVRRADQKPTDLRTVYSVPTQSAVPEPGTIVALGGAVCYLLTRRRS